MNDGVGDVAAPAAADQDLGAGACRPLEQDDVDAGIGSLQENGRGQPGGAGADDGHVARGGNRAHQGKRDTGEDGGRSR